MTLTKIVCAVTGWTPDFIEIMHAVRSCRYGVVQFWGYWHH